MQDVTFLGQAADFFSMWYGEGGAKSTRLWRRSSHRAGYWHHSL